SGFRYTTGWAIGAWFVPILNLWRPKQIANDIWRASDPAAPPEQESTWRDKATPALLSAWWILFIVSSQLGNAAARASFAGDQATDVRNADYADVASLALDVAAAVLAILVVLRLTRRETERARAMQQVRLGLAPAAGTAGDAF